MNNAERRARIDQLFEDAASITETARHRQDEALGYLIDAAHSLRSSMRTIDELNAKIAELKDAVAADEEQDAANEAALQTVITELQAKIDAGEVDFQAQIDALEEIKGSLKSPSGTATTEPGTPE